jgi:hypothetical protein
MPTPGLDAGGVTPELKLRLKFYCPWTRFFLKLFIILLWDVYFYSYFHFFFLYYQLHHHYLLIPTLTPFTLPTSPVLQSIAVLPNYSFCPFSPTLPLPSPPPLPPSLPQPVTRLLFSPTHSLSAH